MRRSAARLASVSQRSPRREPQIVAGGLAASTSGRRRLSGKFGSDPRREVPRRRGRVVRCQSPLRGGTNGDVMSTDLLEQYGRASAWAGTMVAVAAEQPDAPTPCDDWDVKALLSHMLETQRYFVGAARGEDVSPPSPTPSVVLSSDPVAQFEQTRSDVLQTFGEPGVIERTGPSLGVALSDQLLHGWDLAKATEQDATMPDGLAEAALGMIHGMFTEEQRKGILKPEQPVASDASSQEKLLAYSGRNG
jgi:uncharacterized protein (TIGR03086 family)